MLQNNISCWCFIKGSGYLHRMSWYASNNIGKFKNSRKGKREENREVYLPVINQSCSLISHREILESLVFCSLCWELLSSYYSVALKEVHTQKAFSFCLLSLLFTFYINEYPNSNWSILGLKISTPSVPKLLQPEASRVWFAKCCSP